jgi:hypothetical protein
MNVFITLDYEIFFGKYQGTIDKTIIKPTNLLRNISNNTGINFTFFIDIGFIIKLEEHKNRFPLLQTEFDLVTKQIKELIQEGHDCQLHIHPHWEKAIYNGTSWEFDYNFYKLSDFSEHEIGLIFNHYKIKLESLTGRKIHSFRAGGWCIQPFELLESSFKKNEMKIDSSVFLGGKNVERFYSYNFQNSPLKDSWKFQQNECIEESDGEFVELPISSFVYSPLFFWKLFILGNIFPSKHKPIGDGKPMPSNVNRKKLLSKSHLMCASVDGFFSSKMENIVVKNSKKKFQKTVFIGHPKALTYYSLKKLEKFIVNYRNKLHFKTFTDYYNEIS